jgi:hypothetical protein
LRRYAIGEKGVKKFYRDSYEIEVECRYNFALERNVVVGRYKLAS